MIVTAVRLEGVMDKYSRLILTLVFIGLVVFRLVRYVQIGTGRRTSAIPNASVPVPSQSAPPGADPTPSPRPAAPIGLAGSVAAVVSWIGGNALIWTALFGFQYLDSVPVFWRLFVGVFANLYLVRLSRHIGERVAANSAVSQSAGDPFN